MNKIFPSSRWPQFPSEKGSSVFVGAIPIHTHVDLALLVGKPGDSNKNEPMHIVAVSPRFFLLLFMTMCNGTGDRATSKEQKNGYLTMKKKRPKAWHFARKAIRWDYPEGAMLQRFIKMETSYGVDAFRTIFPGGDLQTDKQITDENGIYTNGDGYSFLGLLLVDVENQNQCYSGIYEHLNRIDIS